MAGILLLLIYIALIIVLAVVGFWLVGKMGISEPGGMIARIAVGIVCLFLLIGLFVPGLGVTFPGR